MLFSATMPSAIVGLARMHMRHPMNIRAESSYENATVPATAQFIYQAHDLDKPEMLGRLLQAEGADLTIVFTRTKRQAQRVADDLTERGFKASPLHGDMAQGAREKALTKFREGKLQVLVATDVAARGIDVTGVTHVVNYSCPEDEKTYVHRIGRTGRAGAEGLAVSLVAHEEARLLRDIRRLLKQDIAVENVEGFEPSHPLRLDANPSGQNKPSQGRPSQNRSPQNKPRNPNHARRPHSQPQNKPHNAAKKKPRFWQGNRDARKA
jgi:superfamily II DNA/RNA helicase